MTTAADRESSTENPDETGVFPISPPNHTKEGHMSGVNDTGESWWLGKGAASD
jgi:hypothetical protein